MKEERNHTQLHIPVLKTEHCEKLKFVARPSIERFQEGWLKTRLSIFGQNFSIPALKTEDENPYPRSDESCPLSMDNNEVLSRLCLQ